MKSTTKKATVNKKTGEITAQGRVWQEKKLSDYRQYQQDFNKETYRTFVFRLSKTKDEGMISFLEGQDNLTEYLKILIREDMQNTQSKK